MAMASRLSVTVSMAADTMGMLRLISRVNLVWVLTCPGMTSEGPGSSKTSSKVSPSRISMRLSILRAAYSETCATCHPPRAGLGTWGRPGVLKGRRQRAGGRNAATENQKLVASRDRTQRRARFEARRLHSEGPGGHRRVAEAVGRDEPSSQGRTVPVGDVYAHLLHQPSR